MKEKCSRSCFNLLTKTEHFSRNTLSVQCFLWITFSYFYSILWGEVIWLFLIYWLLELLIPFFFLIFILEREKVHVSGMGWGKGEGKRVLSRLHAEGETQHGAQSCDPGLMTWVKMTSVKWLSHPGAPRKIFLLVSKMIETMQILFLLKLVLILRSTDVQKSLLCYLPNGNCLFFPSFYFN